MDASVEDELMECQSGHLTPHGVEARKDDGLGRVVDDDLDARSGLQRADVTPFAADDAALDLVRIDVKDGDGVLDGGLCGHALDGLDDHLFGLHVGRHLGLLHDLVDVRCGVGFGFVLERLDEALFGFASGESGDGLQVYDLLLVHLFQVQLTLLDQLGLIVQVLLQDVGLGELTLQLLLALAEAQLVLLELGLDGPNLGVSCGHLLLQFGLELDELLLHLQHLVLLHHVRFAFHFALHFLPALGLGGFVHCSHHQRGDHSAGHEGYNHPYPTHFFCSV